MRIVLVAFLLMLGILNSFNIAQAKHAKHASASHRRVYKHKIAHHRVRQAHKRLHLAQLNNASGPLLQRAVNGLSQLEQELNHVINSEKSTANVGVYVKSMQYGDSLYSRNIYMSFTPASTLKILTAEAALLYLGPNYRFSTQLLTDAKEIKKGVLEGNLYIVLSGDPSLTYDDLIDLLTGLKSQQIYSIAGNVYIDNSAYDQSFYGPGWNKKDEKYCYAAPISASIINHNCLAFKPAPYQVSTRVMKTLKSKPIAHAKTKKSTKSTKTLAKNKTKLCSVRISKSITIDRCIHKRHSNYNYDYSYVVTDIPEYNRSLFKNLLFKLGISVYGKITFGSAPDNLSLLNSHNSEPLSALVNEMLKKSVNIIAGALFKKIGQLYFHQPGSWANGSLAVSQILAKQAGLDTMGLRILDGSGLSPENLATPAQMMQILDFAYHHQKTNDAFMSALPIAGVDGTLKHRLNNIARKVRAKTGTISGR